MLLYGNVSITQHEYDLLAPGNWLNDTVIEFYFEYMERSMFSNRRSSFAFLRPDIVHLLAQQADVGSLKCVIEDLNLMFVPVIFIPINDNEGDTPGGSHWSLIIFYRQTNTFYYYDSLHGANEDVARRTGRKLSKFFNVKTPPWFVPVPTPAQENGSDCGVYVLCITELIAEHIAHSYQLDNQEKIGDLSNWNLSRILSPDDVSYKRREIRDLIDSLRK